MERKLKSSKGRIGRLLGLIGLMLWNMVCGAQTYPTTSILASGEWYRMGITKEGVYKISVDDIAVLSGKKISQIGVYGLTGGMLSETNRSTDANDLIPCPIWVYDNNGNGVFENGDYLLFYAEEANVWRYEEITHRFQYQRHGYTTVNYYYITTSSATPTSIDTIKTTEVSSNIVSKHTAVAVHDNDLSNAYNSGRIYVGEKFSSTVTSRTIEMGLTGNGQSDGISCRYAVSTVNAAGATFRLNLGSETDVHTMLSEPGYYEYVKIFADNGASNQHFTMTFTPTENQSEGYLDYIELNASRPMRFQGGQQRFLLSPEEEGTCTYQLATTTKSMRIWAIGEPTTVHEISPLFSDEGDALFQITGNGPHRIVAFDENEYLTPESIRSVENQNLHALRDIDYVIVTHPNYIRQAERLADLHRKEDMMTVSVVTDEQVYNEFSAGKQDPMAIRGLMRMLWNRAQESNDIRQPRYLLLFGKGTYDNRNIEGHNETTIVTYESVNSYHETNSYGSDDMFGYLENGESGMGGDDLDIGIGRLPAHNEDEATHMVEKIERYIHRSDLDRSDIRSDWRTYVTLLADDADPSAPGDTIFVHSAENLANAIKKNHPNINIERIYADAYVQQSGAIGSYYPDVNNALTKRMNSGSLLTNYIGHGSMKYIGTERYISFSDIASYTNKEQQTFFVSSTCTYGNYDQPGDVCGAEMFLLADGGAVGFITASRPIYHTEVFNTDLCNRLLYAGNSIGDALREAKNNTSVSHSILLLGDPAMQLSLPRHQVVVTAINQHPIDTIFSDSASALSEVTISGEVQGADGLKIEDFTGNLYATVFDRETQARTLANDNEGSEVIFSQQKNILFKGTTPVSKGRFEYKFTVPRDINYTYAQGKLSHFAHSGTDDAYGSYSNLYFGGFDTSAAYEELRPKIRLYLNDTNFRSGGTTDATPTLYALLSDSVGINALGTGLGHDITAIIDGRGNSVTVLNDFYQTDLRDNRAGVVQYTLPSLSEGYHTLTLKAWNIYNYSNSATIEFYVSKNDEIEVSKFYAYPNPSKGNSQIRVEHNSPKDIKKAQIDIYNHRGQRVNTLHPTVAEGSYVAGPVTWDFTAENGVALPNGIYVARLTLTTVEGAEIHKTTKIVKIQ
ncbi:MAG: type IX secretion system sortase PorU [Bacteroidales bacterium]|nr:type IX secretion system sortase PorU [Bacteroidales bacterium]